MLYVLRSPLRPFEVAAVATGIVLLTALYCLAYTYFAGRGESLAEASAWAAVNLLPWFFAFEVAKRVRGGLRRSAVLGAALLVSFALQPLAGREGEVLLFELLRRLPGLAIVAVLLALPLRHETRARASGERPLELDLAGIDWISAAGNYVELRGRGRCQLLRASLSSLEAELSSHGFVRIHRSVLVRRDRIARVRPRDVVLADGTALKTGQRYRSVLSQA